MLFLDKQTKNVLQWPKLLIGGSNTVSVFFGKNNIFKYKSKRYRKKGEMNKTEEAYSQHLENLRIQGIILEWKYEPETLKLGKDCRYTPDFRVINKQEIIEFHEVKGTSRNKPFIEDDALVKIKTAAEIHPYKFIICWKTKDGTWQMRDIN